MGDGNLSPNRQRQPRRPVPAGPRRQAGRLPRLEGVAARQHRRSSRRDEREGRRLRRLHAAARARRAARGGLPGRRQEAPHLGLPQGADAAGARRSGTWTTARFTLRSKGLQERTEGGSGRVEICVEAMSRGLPRAAGRVPARRLRPGRHGCTLRGARQKAVLQFTTAATAKLHELIAPFVHPSMEYKLLPRFRGRFAVEPEFVEPTARAGAGAASSTSRSSRRPGRCTASTSRSRARTTTSSTASWCTTARRRPGWQGAEVLRLGPARRAPDRDASRTAARRSATGSASRS